MDEYSHCKDYCCARAGKALGITTHTGRSISEHVTDLVGVNAELVEALKAYSLAQSMPNWGDYSSYEHPAQTQSESDLRIGSGVCAQHGRWYGICASCRYNWESYKDRKDAEARQLRNIALAKASELAEAAIAKAAKLV